MGTTDGELVLQQLNGVTMTCDVNGRRRQPALRFFVLSFSLGIAPRTRASFAVARYRLLVGPVTDR